MMYDDIYSNVYFAIEESATDLVDGLTRVLGVEPEKNIVNRKGYLLFSYQNLNIKLGLLNDKLNLLKELLLKYEKDYKNISFKCVVLHSDDTIYVSMSNRWRREFVTNYSKKSGAGKYYFIQRHRCMITKEYIEENLHNSYLVRPFASYDEAYRYMQNGFWDDSCYGVYYRTDEGDWLMVSAVN